MDKKLKKFELTINNDPENKTGVFAISIVNDPAIEANFMMFSKENPIIFSSNTEEQIITGPVLIPDKLIYRRKNDEGYEVYMSKETIKNASIKFFKKNFANNTTLEHTDKIEDTTYFESWIIEDETFDKSRAEKYNKQFNSLPIGTWMVSLKVNSTEMWSKIKEDGFKGFSIEGIFDDQLVEQKAVTPTKINKSNMKFNVKDFFKKMFTEFNEQYNFEDVKLKDGSSVQIDAEGSVFVLNEDGSVGDIAKDGDYELEDGTTLTVKDGKKVEATKAPEDAQTTASTETVKAEEVKVKYSAMLTLEDKSSITIDDTAVVRKEDGTILEDGEYTLITGDKITIKDSMLVAPKDTASEEIADNTEMKAEFSKTKSELEISLAKIIELEKELLELASKPAAKPIGYISNEPVKEVSLAERVASNIKKMQK